jgi:hypothetical protein
MKCSWGAAIEMACIKQTSRYKFFMKSQFSNVKVLLETKNSPTLFLFSVSAFATVFAKVIKMLAKILNF